MSNFLVPDAVLSKAVTLAATTQTILNKQAAAEQRMARAAIPAVSALIKRGFAEPHMAQNILVGMVKRPELAFETITKLASNMRRADDVTALGAPDTSIQKSASYQSRESDSIWDRGFGLR